MSVNKEQLAPGRIVLTVDESGMFSVTNVHLLADDVIDRTANWIANMHTTVADDIAVIHKNPLYNNSCDNEGMCSDRHWACPYVLASLFGGSKVARRTNRHIYLITPGTIHLHSVVLHTVFAWMWMHRRQKQHYPRNVK